MGNHVFIATSLDGYIAKKDGNLEWLTGFPNPEGGDFGYAEFIQGIDALIMGRNTFETVMAFDPWPYERPVFVLSSHIKKIPEKLNGKVQIISGEIQKVLDSLYSQGFHEFYVDGGKTIQTFLCEDLIDTLIVTKVPILLGGGIPLFGELPRELVFSHEKTTAYPNGLVQSRYVRRKN